MTSTQATGATGEQIAVQHLQAHGLQVMERNFRVRGGEIDIVCRDNTTIVFVEVRVRRRSDFGGAAASITLSKQAKIVIAARHWLSRNPRYAEAPCRFDCVLIDDMSIEWLRDAFAAD